MVCCNVYTHSYDVTWIVISHYDSIGVLASRFIVPGSSIVIPAYTALTTVLAPLYLQHIWESIIIM